MNSRPAPNPAYENDEDDSTNPVANRPSPIQEDRRQRRCGRILAVIWRARALVGSLFSGV